MNTKTIIIFILGTFVVMGGVVGLLWKFGADTGKPIANVEGKVSHVVGGGNITVVEFSDFQCPACSAVQPALKELLKKYEGKIRFVYRHFPLTSIHKNAVVAAQGAEAASLQGKFWEMHDKLFDSQTEWAEESDPKPKFVEYAKGLGLNTEKFLTDMDSQVVKDAVMGDSLDATRYRIGGTPTFYVNGYLTDFGQIEDNVQALQGY